MLRHSKCVVSMTFVCFGIVKLECQISLGIFFLSLICPCMICLKEKYAKKNQKQRDQKYFKYDCKHVYSRKCGSYRMYLEGDSPHQAVMIVCELKWFSHISNHHDMYTLMQSCDIFHTQHAIFFAILDTCASTMWFGYHKVFTCVNVCLLNCLNLFLEYKIG